MDLALERVERENKQKEKEAEGTRAKKHEKGKGGWIVRNVNRAEPRVNSARQVLPREGVFLFLLFCHEFYFKRKYRMLRASPPVYHNRNHNHKIRVS
jgi:hypothetical protein